MGKKAFSKLLCIGYTNAMSIIFKTTMYSSNILRQDILILLGAKRNSLVNNLFVNDMTKMNIFGRHLFGFTHNILISVILFLSTRKYTMLHSGGDPR